MLSSSSSKGKNDQQWTEIDRIFQEILDTANNNKKERSSPSCLHRSDIVDLLCQAAKHTRVHSGLAVIEDAVDTLLEDVQEKTAHGIEGENIKFNLLSKDQFRELFSIHPDLLRYLQQEKLCQPKSLTTPTSNHQGQSHASTTATIATSFSSYKSSMCAAWKSKKTAWTWCLLYFVANLAAFAYKARVYVNRPEANLVFGNCIVVARGSAQCLNLNCALILFPVCRHLLTRCRCASKYMRYIFPFDSVLQYHMFIGVAILSFTILHVGAHICDMHRFAHASEQALTNLFGNKLGEDMPSNVGERWKCFLLSRAGITGIVMVMCMVIAYPMTQIRGTRFNTFWYTHHLLLVMFVTLCFHGTKNMLEPFQSVYWIMVPLTCYLVPRFLRETPISECTVLSAALQNGDVMRIRLAKPKSWGTQLHAGMYAYINIPQVSRLEWHPFTMTSSPSDGYIEFHCRRAGDWTGKMHDLLQECKAAEMIKDVDMESGTESTESSCDDLSITEVSSFSSSSLSSSWSWPWSSSCMSCSSSLRRPTTCTRLSDLVIKVDGPIGAPSQGYSHFPIVVLVAAGIGVTPMISVLKELLDKPGKMKRVFFYWTVRDRKSFEWFGSLMQDIYDEAYDRQNDEDQHRISMHIRPFLTSARQDDQDIGALLLHSARKAKHKKTKFDLLLGHYSHYPANMGRPDWEKELLFVREYAKDELGQHNCGVFLCGPENMARQVSAECTRQSKDDPDFHFYFSKEAF